METSASVGAFSRKLWLQLIVDGGSDELCAVKGASDCWLQGVGAFCFLLLFDMG